MRPSKRIDELYLKILEEKNIATQKIRSLETHVMVRFEAIDRYLDEQQTEFDKHVRFNMFDSV